MKRNTLIGSIVVLAALSTIGCASKAALREARAAREAGRNVEAVLLAVRSLQHNPKNEDALDLLLSLFPQAVDERLLVARRSAASTEPFRWDRVVEALSDIHAMNDAVRSLPGLPAIEVTYHSVELEAARERSAAEHYAAGMEAAGSASRQDQRQAFRHFQKALAMVPGYRDAAQRMAEARQRGSDRILALPVENQAGYFLGPALAALTSDTLLSHLIAARAGKEFVQVIDRSRMDRIIEEQEVSASDLFDERSGIRLGGLLGANLIIAAQVTQADYQHPFIHSYDEPVRREVVEEVTAPDGTTSEIRTLYTGTVTHYRQTARLNATIAYRLIDIETSEIRDANVRRTEVSDTREWSVFKSGDERALDPQQKARLGTPGDRIRGPEEMLEEAAATLGRAIAGAVMARLE